MLFPGFNGTGTFVYPKVAWVDIKDICVILKMKRPLFFRGVN